MCISLLKKFETYKKGGRRIRKKLSGEIIGVAGEEEKSNQTAYMPAVMMMVQLVLFLECMVCFCRSFVRSPPVSHLGRDQD